MASFSKRTLKARAQRAVAAPIKAKLRPGRLIWSLASFAIETAMGRGEMLKLQWWHTNLADGYLDLPRSITKNRKSCLVPLSGVISDSVQMTRLGCEGKPVAS